MNKSTSLTKTLIFAALLAASFGASADSTIGDSGQKAGFSALPGVAAEQLAPSELDKVQGQRFKLRVRAFGIHVGTILMGSRQKPTTSASVDVGPLIASLF